METIVQTLIPHQDWKCRAEQYSNTVKSWTEPFRQQKGVGEKHPVYDFLFSYYSYPMSKLETWHPGFGVLLEAPPDHYFNTQYYREINGSIFIDPTLIPEHRIPSLRWIQSLLKVVQKRTPSFSCFGLHEWAMVYQVDQVRHQEHAPLRLSQEETNTIVESRTIRCSHYDAYRFFSKPAQGFNKLNPEKENRQEYEQPGCLHTNMDLYKWCYKAMPWIPSELLWQCFLLAKDVRELDMRASPYDLSEYNLSPVKIETKEGRDEYELAQRKLSERATPIRKDLIDKLDEILNIAEGRC